MKTWFTMETYAHSHLQLDKLIKEYTKRYKKCKSEGEIQDY